MRRALVVSPSLKMRLLRVCLAVLALACCGATSALAHPEPNDIDGDSVLNEVDNCVSIPNGAQANHDDDSAGDACDADDDNDNLADAADNCALVPNADQLDSDGDGRGDACPPVDTDTDGVFDDVDNCLRTPNSDQRDLAGDGQGDACDRDDDNDQYDDVFDNCPAIWNPDQADADGDRIGSACDAEELIAGPAPTSTGAPATGVAAPPAGPADSSAPTLTVAVDRSFRLKDAGRALIVRVACSEACSLTAVATADATAARRAGLSRTRVVLARGSWSLAGAGRTYVFARWTPTAQRLRAGRRLKASLVLTATDASGNRRSVTRRIDLRR